MKQNSAIGKSSTIHWRFQLRFKIAAAFVAILTPAFLVAGLLIFDQASRALKKQKQEDELVMAKNIAAQVEEVLGKVRKTVEATASLPSLRGEDLSRLRATLTLVIQVTELLDGLIFYDPAGRALVTDGADPDTRRLFTESSYERFVRPCLRENATVVSNVYRSATGEAAVGISAPVFREGRLAGVLTAGVLLQNHSLGGMEEIRIGKSGYAYLVDGEGQIIAHPQADRLFEDIRQNPPVQELLRTRSAGVTDFKNADGIRVVAAHAPVGRSGWGVVVRQPASETYAEVRRLFGVFWAIVIAVLLLSLSAGWVLAWRLGQPLARLNEGVQRLAKGELTVTVPVETENEFGALTRAFNAMTRDLRLRIEESAAVERRMARNEKLAAVGQLAAGVAHEINNPLNVIVGFAEHLRDTTLDNEKMRGPLEEILRETERCRALVRNLVDFARPSETRAGPVNLPALVEEILSLISPQAKARNVQFNVSRSLGVPLARADRDQTKQVLLNLFLNAEQSMPRGGVVDIVVVEAGGAVEVAVRDRGPGFTPDGLTKVFTPFFTTKEEGTGLGLAVSHALVARQGGVLRAENHPNGGALLTLRLPKEATSVVIA